MGEYKFVGTKCFYANIIIPGEGSLVANPGDVREFDTPPDPVYWVPVADKPADPPPPPAPPEPPKPAPLPDVKDVK